MPMLYCVGSDKKRVEVLILNLFSGASGGNPVEVQILSSAFEHFLPAIVNLLDRNPR